jgi:aminopeptidase N
MPRSEAQDRGANYQLDTSIVPQPVVMRRRHPLQIVVTILCVLAAALGLRAQTRDRAFGVLGYAATIRPNIQARTVAGEVRVRLEILSNNLATIDFDRADLIIESVRQENTPLDFDLQPRRLRVHLPAPVRRGDLRTLVISYRGAPRSGLQFVPEREQVYTTFSTSQWLVCVDAPEDKATLDLEVVLPAGLRAVGSGILVGKEPGPDGMVVHRWRQAQPVSTYLFGFAAGRFAEAAGVHGRTTLRYLGDGFSRADLDLIFHDSPDMVEFFERRAGIAYQGDTYTQVLVADTAGQEASLVSLLSERYGRALLNEPTGVSLIAHELAHQWWGNLVTCEDWTHFWLNEGFATFMACRVRRASIWPGRISARYRASAHPLRTSAHGRRRSLTRLSGLGPPNRQRSNVGLPEGSVRSAPIAGATGRRGVLGGHSAIHHRSRGPIGDHTRLSAVDGAEQRNQPRRLLR